MVAPASTGFRYSGDLGALLQAVKAACRESSLAVKDEQVEEDAFKVTAIQSTNFMSTNWPVTLEVGAERTGDGYAITIRGESDLWSFTQRANNKLRAEHLAEMIRSQLGSGPPRQ